MRIGISGATGMIGWHMRCYLKQFRECSTVVASRRTFENERALRNFVANSDVIVHLAGQNRGSDREIAETNPRLARNLTSACSAAGVAPHICYASSTHVNFESPYGISKRISGEILHEWAAKNGVRFCNVILPHVFGEGTRPFYNSVVATFAYQLAVGEEPKVIQDAELELVHAQDVCREFLSLLRTEHSGDVCMSGSKITVRDVLERLRGLSAQYMDHVIPDLRDPIDLKLFNLFRSYLFPLAYPRTLISKSDIRGSLVETVKALNGGQAFFSTTKPGNARGNHFHYQKVERFCVIRGEARIRVRRLFDGTIHTFNVNGEDPVYIDMPTLHTHDIVNTGSSDLLTLFWANEIFDPDYPDTIPEPVEA